VTKDQVGESTDTSLAHTSFEHHYSNRKALLTAAVLVTASLCAIPVKHVFFHFVPAFMAAFVSVTGVFDLLTAILLFQLYVAEGRRILFCAAAAYMVDSLLVWPYGLTFPGVYPQAIAFSNEQSAGWLWLTWHMLFPLILSVGACCPPFQRDKSKRKNEVRAVQIGVFLVCCICTAIVTAGRAFLPLAVSHGTYLPTYTLFATFISCLNFASVAILMRSSELQVEVRAWFAVAALASALDVGLNAWSPARFTMPWYLGKFEMLMTSGVVLLALMRSWGTLYATSVSLSRSLDITRSQRSSLQKRLEHEHMIAAELQQASLPHNLPGFDDITLSAVYRPAVHDLEIGGDWYDAFVLPDGRLVLTIGDVAGKGLAASLVMGKVRQMLRIAAYTNPDPATMLNVTDCALLAEYPNTIVTAFVAILDRSNATMTWASAGHPPPFYRNRQGSLQSLDSLSLPLGIRNGDPPSEDLILSDGSMLVFYTDGLIESDLNILEGFERLQAVFSDKSIYDAANPARLLHERIIGDSARDDIAIVTLKFDAREQKVVRRSWNAHSGDQALVADIRASICRELRGLSGCPELAFSVEISYSELVGNILRYAPGPFHVELENTDDQVVLTVIDEGPGFTHEPRRDIDLLAERGRGLLIISNISSSLEIRAGEEGGSIAKVAFSL
jgi:anti-sigma regulatory factor (Ser/Thr protein kinase)